MNRILLSITAGLLISNSSALFAQCTAGQLDVSYGPAGSAGYVQTAPVTLLPSGGGGGEDVVADSSNSLYLFAGAAIDAAGNLIPNVIRLKAGGARDITYGGFGSVVLPIPASGIGFANMTIDPQGRLVVAVLSADASTLSFTRYSPTGALDLSYGTSGTSTITLPFSGQTFSPQGVSAGPDGSVTFAITFQNPAFHPASQPAVVRVTPSGALDTTFGTGGYSTVFPAPGRATDVKAQADGTVIVGGRLGDNATHEEYFVARLLANGSLDTSFASGAGITTADFGGALASGRKLAIQSNGKIVLGGSVTTNNLSFDIGLIRLKTNGALDPTFNGTGMARVSLNNAGGTQIALQNNDKILVYMDQYTDATQTNTQPAVARFTSSGQLDPAFGSGGVSVIAPAPGFPDLSSSGFTYAGKIVAHFGGYDPVSNQVTEFVARIDDGTGVGCH